MQSVHKPVSVLFVCLGNICRSPLAEGLFLHHAMEQARRDGNSVRMLADSAGTGNWHAGEPPHPGSVLVAAAKGIDINGQRARQFQRSDHDRFDYIFAMDASNLSSIRSLGNGKAITARLLDFAGDAGEGGDVPDPWGKGEAAYADVCRMLDEATQRLVGKLGATMQNRTMQDPR